MKRWFLLSILAVAFIPLGHSNSSPTWCGYSYNQQTSTANYADAEIGLVASMRNSTIWFANIMWGDSLAQPSMDSGTINGFSCVNPPSNTQYYHALHQYQQNGTYTVTIYYGENLISEGSVSWTWTITLIASPIDSSPSGGGLGWTPVKL